ncbi:MAG: hypothetical protein GY705_09510 [Bacteroidetes bacterium]|nr:hypothetical protein [Bacteroidota bacterium]
MKLHSFGLGSFVLDEIPGEKGIFPSFAYTGIASVFYLSMRLVIGAFFIRALIWLVKEGNQPNEPDQDEDKIYV